ncbi:TetR/AcrR family transcriptional regulator [Microbacterium sp. ET2]|uniref:TetR/AcrR family transcriptional regulator n=1 Tax=Microbacterium albipurpureum TaxID=3050384 RepID=UPI00259C6D0A|nr:TetR/AcrR family transcriptional regulator [Microbacterium sp. ET2 (Ac-2212)]WJL94139.1 TetR/AcrR family transcriptional regulator [Microbacterium sp. ET2 (Ac-2212)]
MEQTRRGRPRSFDSDAALEKALVVFWEHGYEGASLALLTEAMGISRKSMYAAFGNKEDLFLKVLQLYEKGPGSYARESVAALTAREVARAYLDGAVRAGTQPGRPSGCFGVRAALAVGVTGETAQGILTTWRARTRSDLRDRFRRAIGEGDLPADADPDLIARYLTAVADGVSVEAAGGAPAEDLQRVVDAALLNWPPS